MINDTEISMMCTNMLAIPVIYTQYQYTVQLLQIVDAFARCVGGLLSVIGANLSYEISTTNGTTISEVHSVHWNSDNKKWIFILQCLSNMKIFTCIHTLK